MSRASPGAVGVSASDQPSVTSQMNGMITSQPRDSAERSPAAAAAGAGHGGDVLKSSLPRPQDAVSCAAGVSDTVQQLQNDISAAPVDSHR